jgi:hypothetical protein
MLSYKTMDEADTQEKKLQLFQHPQLSDHVLLSINRRPVVYIYDDPTSPEGFPTIQAAMMSSPHACEMEYDTENRWFSMSIHVYHKIREYLHAQLTEPVNETPAPTVKQPPSPPPCKRKREHDHTANGVAMTTSRTLWTQTTQPEVSVGVTQTEEDIRMEQPSSEPEPPPPPPPPLVSALVTEDELHVDSLSVVESEAPMLAVDNVDAASLFSGQSRFEEVVQRRILVRRMLQE